MRISSRITPWVMLAPALIFVFGLILYPAAHAIYLSMTATNPLDIASQQFVGLANFIAIFNSGTFWIALRNSLTWTLGIVAAELVLGMIGGLMLNARFRGRAAVRGILVLPWATPSVLVALMFLWIFDPSLGIIDKLIRATGLGDGQLAWLSNYHLALPTLMLIQAWNGVPFFMIMILAALQGLSAETIEAARIDGANAWKLFWSVRLPLIMPTLLITIVLRLIWTANNFDIILVLTSGGPADATMTLPLYAYTTAYRSLNFGQGTALGVIQAVVLSIVIVFYVRRVRKDEAN